ncbi:C40 family peptidase [Rhodococcus sp. HNM0569]|uniref:C40 family peptidase n=1 Tax=Rhodococcus sp. HNM0569 TaxID=2716340 RepID=UPI00146D1E1C|nr:C40 family peptidase [Rhodococcus sp. HNM0569]NLU82888.1 C40 family peptidase [Rhodococcus sp. HNM0569]
MPAAADPARTAPPARTDPVVLDGATDAMNRLADLGRKSEQTNEALHNAQIELDAKQAAQAVADERVAQAQVALDEAEGLVAQYRPTVDKLALANYQGARTNRLFAVMVSDSPQQLLDQMSALDVIAQQTSDDVGQFADARIRAQQAADEARSAADAARAASDAARVVQDELGRTKADLERQIGDVTDAFDSLTDEERLKLAGSPFPPGIDADAILAELLPGSGSGALQAAMTRIGSPYVWGATGPDSFDCSGLVVWAYQQVGKTLPRSSQAQAAGGTPISRDQLQPGDVVIIYDDASHVGLYAGNGNLLHASTFGVPVKVESLDGMDYAGARRY